MKKERGKKANKRRQGYQTKRLLYRYWIWGKKKLEKAGHDRRAEREEQGRRSDPS